MNYENFDSSIHKSFNKETQTYITNKKKNVSPRAIDLINDTYKEKNVIIATDNPYRAYTIYESYDSFIKSNVHKHNNNLYEVMPLNVPRYFYIDIDGRKSKDNNEKKIYKKIIKFVKQLSIECFNIKLNKKQIYILSASDDKKISYHIRFNQLIFKNNGDCKKFAEVLYKKCLKCKKLNYEKLNKKNEMKKYCVMDLSVYKKNQQYRFINQSKKESPRVLKKISKYEDNYLFNGIYNNINNLSYVNMDIINSDIENYKNEKTKNDKTKNDKTKNNNVLSKIMNEYLDINDGIKWESHKDGDSYRLTHNSKICMVDLSHNHSDLNHSCIFINKRCITASCYSHKKKKLENSKVLKKFLGLYVKNKNDLKCRYITKDSQDKKLQDYNDILKAIPEEGFNDFGDIQFILKNIKKDISLLTADIGKVTDWYYYNNGVWEIDEAGYYIRHYILTTFLKKYMNFIQITHEEDKNNNHDGFLDLHESYIPQIKRNKNLNELINQCSFELYDKSFNEKMDSNLDFLCFGKMGYDFELCKFRETKKEDYCTAKMGLDYKDVNKKLLKEFNDVILNKIFMNEEERQYFINVMSCAMHSNFNQVFHIWTGVGSNGKSLLSKLLYKAFGGYIKTLPISLLTRKQADGGQATPNIAKTRNSRLVCMSEPKSGSKLNNSFMKQLTGGEILSYRELYKSTKYFTPRWTPIISCNSEFELEDINDDSIKRRLIFIKFRTSFVKEEDYKNLSYQVLRNDELMSDKSIKKYIGPFMYLLFNNWRILKKNNLKFKTPDIVRNNKSEFIDDSDIIKRYIDENIEKTDNKNDFICSKELYKKYAQVCKDNGDRKQNLKSFIIRASKYITYSKRYRYYEGGKQKEKRSVFINCRVIEENDFLDTDDLDFMG